MYSNATFSGPLVAGSAVLPFTGLGVNLVWLVLAAFALICAGGALLRIAPSLHPQPKLARHALTRRRR